MYVYPRTCQLENNKQFIYIFIIIIIFYYYFTSSNVQCNPLSTGFYALCSCYFAQNVQLKFSAKCCSLFVAYSWAGNHNLTLCVGSLHLKYANMVD